MIYSNGDVFVGEWRNDQAHGRGTLTRADGSIDKGFWNRNMLDGKGI